MREAIIVLLAVVACAPVRPSRGVDEVRTYVEVDNRGLADMTIYVIDGAQRVRIGIAAGNARTELRIPDSLVGRSRQLQFLADPIGSRRTAVSDTVFVERGDRVVLMIPAQ